MNPTGPFDRHPAVPLALENRADTLVRLAEEAVDHRAVTDRAFDPAVASWDGLAAAELRAAPEPLRGEAEEVASQVAWAAVPMLVWADHVRSFNHKVDDLLDRRGQVPVEVERRVRQLYSDFDDRNESEQSILRESARGELIRELEQAWRDAFQLHVDQGEQDVAAMYRIGPTWQNLELARGAGAIPAGPMVEFFTVRWDWTATIGEAQRIAALIVDPGQVPTDEELERLAGLLEQHAEDEEFAFLFLTELGPAGVVELNLGLAVLASETDLAAPATIQEGLGLALATATTRRGGQGSAPWGGGEMYHPGEYELPPEWIQALRDAGRQSYPLFANGAGSDRVYGYQALAPLLTYGVYDEHFLQLIGGDMIDFEMALGGSEAWHNVHGSVRVEVPLDLSLTGDPRAMSEQDPLFGYDPIAHLLDAFEDNPYGARAALTGSVVALDGGGVQLPRVDYLVTDREWEPGGAVDTLGRVLEHATGITVGYGPGGEMNHPYPPDERSFQIMEAIVYAVGNDEQALGYPNDPTGQGLREGHQAVGFDQVAIVPDPLRPYLGRIAAGYIDDVHWGMAGRDNRHEDLPGEQKVSLDPRDLQVFLAELGKNGEARDTIVLAEEIYTAALYDYYLSGGAGDTELDAQLRVAGTLVIDPAARMFGALDYGAVTEIDGAWNDRADEFNLALRREYLLYEMAKETGLDLGMPGAIGTLVQESLDRDEADQEATFVGEANYEQGTLRELGRARLMDQAVMAVYRNLDPAELPEDVREKLVDENGELKPIEDWYHRPDSAESEMWDRYLSNEGGDFGAFLENQARQAYNAEFDTTQQDLDGSGLRQRG